MDRLVRCMVGGSADAESKRCELDDKARTVGGEGCVGKGSSKRNCLQEYVWTEFWREVVKNIVLASLPYLRRRT